MGSPTPTSEDKHEDKQDVPERREQEASEVELLLEEEKGESEALTSYLRGLLQDECETPLQRESKSPNPMTDQAASFAFTTRLANLKNGF